MAPTVTGTPQNFTFTASGTVVTYTGGGVATGSIDVLCVNSDNTVTVPGWTAAATRVSQQGAYVFTCDGGTTTTATINLGGGINTNTHVSWLRIAGTAGVDSGATATAGVDTTAGTTTPAVTSGALATGNELVIAFAALHNLTGGTPTAPVWSAGYVQQTSGTIGGSPTGVYGNVAVKAPAGTAAESPSLTWSGTANDRYILVVAFLQPTTASGTAAVALPPLAAAGTGTVTGTGAAPLTLPPFTASAAGGGVPTTGGGTIRLPALSAAAAGALALPAGYSDPEVLIARWLHDLLGVKTWSDPRLPSNARFTEPVAHVQRGQSLATLAKTLDDVTLDVDVYAHVADHARDTAARICTAMEFVLPKYTFPNGLFVTGVTATLRPIWAPDPAVYRRTATYRVILHGLT